MFHNHGRVSYSYISLHIKLPLHYSSWANFVNFFAFLAFSPSDSLSSELWLSSYLGKHRGSHFQFERGWNPFLTKNASRKTNMHDHPQTARKNRSSRCCYSVPPPRITHVSRSYFLKHITWILLLLIPEVCCLWSFSVK